MAGMTSSQLEYLDGIAADVRKGDDTRWSVLSTGEKLYVALAGNSKLLLDEMEYTIPEALARLGTSDIMNLIDRWQYRG
jgi:hypothetical protein